MRKQRSLFKVFVNMIVWTAPIIAPLVIVNFFEEIIDSIWFQAVGLALFLLLFSIIGYNILYHDKTYMRAATPQYSPKKLLLKARLVHGMIIFPN